MMKKNKFLLVLTICILFLPGVVRAASVGSGTGGYTADGGSTGCTSNLCYTSDEGVGIRFSIVTVAGEKTDYQSIDLLSTTKLKAKLEGEYSGRTFLTLGKLSKREISSAGYEYFKGDPHGASIVEKTGSELAATASGLSWYLSPSIDNLQVSPANATGQEIYSNFFGSDNPQEQKIVKNYNAGSDIAGSVFETGGGTDKGAFDEIIKEIVGESYNNDTLDNLAAGRYLLQLEPITIINLRAGGENQRYLIYGTTSEILAITAKIANENVYGGNYYDTLTYGWPLFLPGSNAALKMLNTGMYSTVQLGSSYYGGNASTCSENEANWILPQYHNCGIGIIDFSNITTVETHTCEVIEDDTIYGGYSFYDSSSRHINDYDAKPTEGFTNSCVCDPFSTETNKYYNGYSKDFNPLKNDFYGKYGANVLGEGVYKWDDDLNYITTWCESSTITTPPATTTSTEEPEFSFGGCSEYEDVKTSASYYNTTIKDKNFNIFSNIDTFVSDSSGSDANKYTTWANEYCNVSCAEEIDIHVPGQIAGDNLAGTYFEIADDMIKLKGTRICQETVDMDSFNQKVVNSSSDTLNAKYTKTIETRGATILYSAPEKNSSGTYSISLAAQNDFLKKLYDAIKNLNNKENSMPGYRDRACNNVEHYEYDESTPSGTVPSRVFYCEEQKIEENGFTIVLKQYYEDGNTYVDQYEVNIYGDETNRSIINFSRYLDDQKRNAYDDKQKTEFADSAGLTLENFKNELKNYIQTTADSIEEETGKLNMCATSYGNDIGKSYYFKPEVRFAYEEDYSKYFTTPFSIIVDNNDDGVAENVDPEEDAGVTNDDNATLKSSDVYYYKTADSSSQSSSTYDYPDNSYSGTGYKMVNSKVTKIRKYKTSTQFYRQSPSGIISPYNNGFAGTVTVGNDGYVYPIELSSLDENETSKNKNYYLYFSNLGQVNLHKEGGRFDKFFYKYSEHTTDDDKKLKYACTYNVKNDVTLSDTPTFFFRNISLNNINPNNRDLGKNWNDDNAKAEATKCEIGEDFGSNNIKKGSWNFGTGQCDDNTGKYPEEIENTPEYSFTLTPDNMKAIREYNSDKAYSNFDMEEYITDTQSVPYANGDYAGDAYKGIWFKSKFLDTMVANGFAEKADVSHRKFTGWNSSVKLSGTGPAWK